MAKLPERIEFTVDVKSALWGPRPYTERSADNAVPRFDFTVPIKEGNPDTADIAVEVTEYGDNEIDIEVHCLCHACELLANGGTDDLMEFFRPNVYGKPTPGVYFLKAWFERYPATVNGPEEYEAGWEIARPLEE